MPRDTKTTATMTTKGKRGGKGRRFTFLKLLHPIPKKDGRWDNRIGGCRVGICPKTSSIYGSKQSLSLKNEPTRDWPAPAEIRIVSVVESVTSILESKLSNDSTTSVSNFHFGFAPVL